MASFLIIRQQRGNQLQKVILFWAAEQHEEGSKVYLNLWIMHAWTMQHIRLTDFQVSRQCIAVACRTDMKVDNDLAGAVEATAHQRGQTMSEFTRQSLPAHLARHGARLTMDEISRLWAGAADGEGQAPREKARKAFKAMQKGDGRLDASAARTGVVADPKIGNNGSVSVVVQRPGPDTNVRTSASGSLFKDVVLSRGQTMAPAERT